MQSSLTRRPTVNEDSQEFFAANGYLTGIEIMSPAEMATYQREFDRLEATVGKQAAQVGLTNVHKENERIWELVTHPKVLATVSQVLGPDLLLLGSHFFCKYPDLRESYVSWHQDVTYWGLEPPTAVTLWLSIDGADVENGCMQFIPGSHQEGLLPHGKAQVKGNLLSVNQEISSDLVKSEDAVHVELVAGSASLHNGMLIHGSNPNHSTRRRCGLTMRFTRTDVVATGDPEAVQWKPILIQGEDKFGNFNLDPWPEFARSRGPQPFFRPFAEGEPYVQEEPGEASFRWLLKKDEVPGLQIGHVELQGPIHKTPGSHEHFHQVYLIQEGRGLIHVGNQSRRVNGPTVVVIPKNTRHSIEVAAGERLRYEFINQHA